MVTHEARHAAWADRVVFLRDGVIVDETGADEPEELLAGEVRHDERVGARHCASPGATRCATAAAASSCW